MACSAIVEKAAFVFSDAMGPLTESDFDKEWEKAFVDICKYYSASYEPNRGTEAEEVFQVEFEHRGTVCSVSLVYDTGFGEEEKGKKELTFNGEQEEGEDPSRESVSWCVGYDDYYVYLCASRSA